MGLQRVEHDWETSLHFFQSVRLISTHAVYAVTDLYFVFLSNISMCFVWCFYVCSLLQYLDLYLMYRLNFIKKTSIFKMIWNVKSSGMWSQEKKEKESITTNKASGDDGIPVELFQILKDDAGESAALNMPANLENSAVATGLEKVSFHSNPKKRKCQRMLKLPHNRMLKLLHNCTHLTH